jgi:hypothetical protein
MNELNDYQIEEILKLSSIISDSVNKQCDGYSMLIAANAILHSTGFLLAQSYESQKFKTSPEEFSKTMAITIGKITNNYLKQMSKMNL